MGYNRPIGELKCGKLRIPRYGSQLFAGALSQEWERRTMPCNHFIVFDPSRFKGFLDAGTRMPWRPAFIGVANV